MVDTTRLNEAIKASGYLKSGIAARLGISRQSFSNKLSNRTAFRASEASYLKGLLNLSSDDFIAIFFKSDGALKAPRGGLNG